VSPSTATGNVVFADGPLVLAIVPLSGDAPRSPVSTLSAGTHTITTDYSGDAADAPSIEDVRTVTVAQVKPSVVGQTVTFTSTISANSATGTVTFNDGTQAIGTAPVSNGIAVFSTTALPVGNPRLRPCTPAT
jgi:Bacterial Ig-like domain (group 3)